MPVITISSEFGAGGPAVGKQLAERLGYDYVDQDLIARVALDLGVPEEKVAEFDEARHSRLRSFLTTVFDFQALKKDAPPAPQAEAPTAYDDRDEIPYQFQVKGWIDRDVYRQMMVRVISALGQRGGAVIKGRGSQWILKDNPEVLHLRFVADLDDRVARTMERRGLDREAAGRLVTEMDQRGEGYVRAYFDHDLKDPTLYHLVLNSSRIPLDRCLALVEGLTRDLFPGDAP